MDKIELPLSEYTLSQKLYLLEVLWEDLSRNEDVFASPEWHEQVLTARESSLNEGQTVVEDWEVFKERLRKKLC